MDFSVIGYVLSGVVGALLLWVVNTARLGSFRQHALSILRQAEHETEQKKAVLALELKNLQCEHETKLKQELSKLETHAQRLKSQREQLSRDTERVKKDQSRLLATQREAEEYARKIKEEHGSAQRTLEQIAKMSSEEARSTILQKAKEDSLLELERSKALWLQRFERDCSARAASLLVSALERKAQTLTKETFLTPIPLKDRSFIPRCIGKDGRNIQTLEELLQVSLIIEEHVPRLLVSAHDGKSRAIAKTTIERLIEQEKVTPVTIRDAHEMALASFSHDVVEEGRTALKACGCLAILPQEIHGIVGQLAYRSSSGQNALKHSMEVSEMMGILAEELGLRSDKAKAMGLLHDIGKALSPEWGYTHAAAGKAFLEKWGVDSDIVNAVAAHHGEEPQHTEEARLLPISDRLSAQLPGVRQQQDPPFLAMVRQCEERTKNLPNVLSSWAHYAGNHIELVVRHAPMEQTTPFLCSLQEALVAANLPIPVNITLVEKDHRRL